jgi:hypothetical protein
LLVDAGDSDEVEHVVGADSGDLTRSPYTPSFGASIRILST